MGEMVERVAKAICEALGDDWSREGLGGLKRGYAPVANAAIEAMREPTPEMTKAARLRWNAGHDKTAWRLMIDAALAEK